MMMKPETGRKPQKWDHPQPNDLSHNTALSRVPSNTSDMTEASSFSEVFSNVYASNDVDIQ